jgi:hypothetical protein
MNMCFSKEPAPAEIEVNLSHRAGCLWDSMREGGWGGARSSRPLLSECWCSQGFSLGSFEHIQKPKTVQ